jgi:ubiquitin-conjugating enzyme E2 J1
MREASELSESTEDYHAQPLEDNLFEWHFTIRGSSDSIYSDGVYHGRLVFPTQYPLKPPSVIMLTPNGRFDVNTRICLSISDYHPETWLPSWSIRTALLAIITFMVTETDGAIGALDYTKAERKTLALNSLKWKCPECGSVDKILKERSDNPDPDSEQLQKDRELAKQITFQRPTTSGSSIAFDSTQTSNVSSTSDSTLTTEVLGTSPPSVQPAVHSSPSNRIPTAGNDEPVAPTRPVLQARYPRLSSLLTSNLTLISVLVVVLALVLRRYTRVD